MGSYTVTLTTAQEDALAAVIAETNRHRPGPPQTEATMVQELLNGTLVGKEVAIQQALDRMADAGRDLPEAVRERMLAGLSPAQRQRLLHLSSPGLEEDSSRGRGPERLGRPLS